MPSNIRQLKSEMAKRIRADRRSDQRRDIRADLQKRVVTLMLVNLMRFTNVDKGELAGGWTVRLRGMGGNTRATVNRSRVPNPKQLAPIEKIKGKSTINISNSVPHARYVNSGTRYQIPSMFVEMAATVTKRQMKALGINIKISGTA